MSEIKNLKLIATKDGWIVEGRKRKRNFYTNILDIILEEMNLYITYDETFKKIVTALSNMKTGDTLKTEIHNSGIPSYGCSFREYLIEMADLARDKEVKE